VHRFTNDRPHSGINYHSPIEHEKHYDQKRDATNKPAIA